MTAVEREAFWRRYGDVQTVAGEPDELVDADWQLGWE